jgi:type IV fimbrial biogenesis protein FimT
MRALRGFTLVELLVTMTVLGIVLVAAMPSFVQMVDRSQLRAAAETWMNHAHLARIEAQRTGKPVFFSARPGQCYGFRVGDECDCAQNTSETACTFARWDEKEGRVRLSANADAETFIEPVSGLVENPDVLVWQAGDRMEIRTGFTRLGRPWSCSPDGAKKVPGYATRGCE